MPRNPPQYDAVTLVRRVFRYRVTTALSGCILNESQMIAIPGGVCTVANTTLLTATQCIKLHRIRMWGPSPASGAVSTVALQWMGSTAVASNMFGVNKIVSDTSVNISDTPVVDAAPPPGSRQSFWLGADNSGTDPYLSFESAPVGSIIDFDLEFAFGMDPTVTAVAYGIGTGVQSVWYWPILHATAGSGVLTPVDLTATD